MSNATSSQPEATDGDHEAPSAPTDRDPVHRVGYAFVPDGENLWVYAWFEPGAKLPEHLHPRQEERWEVLDGTAQVQIGERTRPLQAEDGPQPVAPGVKHALENTSGAAVRLRCHVLPAGELRSFLEDSAAAARDGLIMRGGIPKGIRGARWGARFLKRHRGETVMSFPPRFAQNAMIALFARD